MITAHQSVMKDPFKVILVSLKRMAKVAAAGHRAASVASPSLAAVAAAAEKMTSSRPLIVKVEKSLTV